MRNLLPEKHKRILGTIIAIVVLVSVASAVAGIAENSTGKDSYEAMSAVAGIIVVIAVFFIINRFKKILRQIPPPGKTIFQALLLSPKILEKMIAENARNKDSIITEIKKFKKVKKVKEIDKNTLDILAVHTDDSEHLYRLGITEEKGDKKITSLTRYS